MGFQRKTNRINTLMRSSSGGSEEIDTIPLTNALEIAIDLIQYGEVRRGWLGFSIDRQALIRKGQLVISEVVDGSPAFNGDPKNDSLNSINSEDATYEICSKLLLDLSLEKK